MDTMNENPVPRGVAGSGAAFLLGDATAGLRWLQKSDALHAAQQARAQAAAQRQNEANQRDFSTSMKLNDEAGVSFLPAVAAHAQDTHEKMLAVATNPSLSQQQKSYQYRELADTHNRFAKASVTADKFLSDTATSSAVDKRVNRDRVYAKLHDTLYEHNEDGSFKLNPDGTSRQVSPVAYDVQAVQQALSTGNDHINAPELFTQFIDKLPEDSITTTKEPLPGGRGYKTIAKSPVFEMDDSGIRRDKNGKRILRNTYETLAAFDTDPLQKQYLDAEEAKHRQVFAGAVEKLQAGYPQLSPEEAEAVRVEQSPQGRRLETLSKALVKYGYGREEHDILQKPARVPHTSAAAKAPKFREEGGTSFGPEVIGGMGAQGTPGLLSLSSSDPLFRVKADGSRQPHSANLVLPQYNLLQNGQPSRLVSNNASPQALDIIKPQLHVTTADGRALTPTDPTLLQRYQQGDRRPLLNWVRDQKENDSTTSLKWHMLTAPSHGKLTAENGAQAIFKHLQAERAATHKAPGDAGYQGDEKLHQTAQQLASQQGSSLLVPYWGPTKNALDGASGYTLRDATRQKRMDAELDYFNRETAPRPVGQRTAPKKNIGIDFGTAAPATAPAAPATPPFKRAGTKKTGISF